MCNSKTNQGDINKFQIRELFHSLQVSLDKSNGFFIYLNFDFIVSLLYSSSNL